MAQLRLGLIGLGAMGSRIATRLLRTGFSLEIYDIADVAMRMFNMDVGGSITGSPKMMAQACNVIITVLPSAAEVREVAFGWEGVARGFAGGGVLIDMGSSDPIATKRLAEELGGCGIDMVDAPALGTAEDAKAGKLSFVVGGSEAAVERCRPIFEALGERILRAGTTGSGQAAALAVDELIQSRLVRVLSLAQSPSYASVPGSVLPYGKGDIEEMWKVRDAQCPMGHMGDAWDVAYACLYLASDESKYVTGLDLVVDGGISLKLS